MKRPLAIITLYLLAIHATIAQKLPNKQKASLRAPANIKIDGKATEWGNKLEAFNRATEVLYTVSNDDENIYFTIRGVNTDVVRRIVGGGISLTLKNADENSKQGNLEITYPVFEQPVTFKLNVSRGELSGNNIRTADSIKVHNNSLVDKYCRSIKVIGSKNLDTLISVYNTDGIRAYGLFDDKKAYTCEFLISLKHFGITLDRPSVIKYNLRINGTKPAAHAEIYGKVDDPKKAEILQNFLDNANAKWDQLSTPTYFTSEYTLAKKP